MSTSAYECVDCGAHWCDDDMPGRRTAIDPCDQEFVRMPMGAPDERGGKLARMALAKLEGKK